MRRRRRARRDQIGQLLFEVFRDQDAIAEVFIAWIGEGEIGLGRWLAVPGREHAEILGQVFHRDLGPQLVEFQLGGEAVGKRLRAIDQEPAAMTGRRFRDQKIHDDLALRRQQRAESAEARLQLVDIGRDEAIEEVARILARDLDHAPVRKKR